MIRGALVESRHRGAIAVADAKGRLLLALGDVERPIYPRSAVKAMQALPLIESGAADAFALSEDELAVACASHSGDSVHVEAVRSLLAKAGLDESYLACGAHWPISEDATRELLRGRASARARSTIIARASMPACWRRRCILGSSRKAMSGRTIKCRS